jgi:hypothetical protein
MPEQDQDDAAGQRRAGVSAKDWVAVILAVGMVAGLLVITVGALIDAQNADQPGLSENATQLLTAAFGGVIGVLGSYLGFKAGERHERRRSDD